MDRLPDNKKLDINKTFENQRKHVNGHIIPIVQKSLNKNIFSVDDSIIRHIIHERHRHQREESINRTRSEMWNDNEKRRKHANSRRSDVSENRVVYFMILSIIFYYLETRAPNESNWQINKIRGSCYK